MNISITIGKIPPFEIEDATAEQVMETLTFIESLHEEPLNEHTFMRPSFSPKLEVAE